MWRLDDWLCMPCFARRRRPIEFEEGSVVWAKFGGADNDWWPGRVISIVKRGETLESNIYLVQLYGKTETLQLDYLYIFPFTDVIYHGIPLTSDLDSVVDQALVDREVHVCLYENQFFSSHSFSPKTETRSFSFGFMQSLYVPKGSRIDFALRPL